MTGGCAGSVGVMGRSNWTRRLRRMRWRIAALEAAFLFDEFPAPMEFLPDPFARLRAGYFFRGHIDHSLAGFELNSVDSLLPLLTWHSSPLRFPCAIFDGRQSKAK